MQNNNFNFLEEFKALDNICKDIFNSDKGVTTYIDQMKTTPSYERSKIQGFETDLSRLISLRHVRNNLSHEVGTLSQNLCSMQDIDWLKAFKKRILKQTDPLALLHKDKSTSTDKATAPHKSTTKPSRFAIAFYTIFAAIVVLIIIALAKLNNL